MKSFLAYIVFLALVNAGSSVQPTQRYTAYVFMGTECPISQKYIPTLNDIAQSHPQLQVIGVFSEQLLSAELDEFRTQFNVNFELMHDPNFEMADRFSAAVTPEVFLVDHQGTIGYSGAIDNWFVSLGRNRLAPSERYLLDAFNALLGGGEVLVSKTQAIGCFLERHKPAVHGHH
jgi:thiol-disulfide isomerase/thioredoxin